MNKNHVKMIICILLLLLPLSSCSESSFPTGTFVSDSGDYQLILIDNGSFTFSEFGTVVARGIYSIHANEFTFEMDSFCGEREATYTWTFENDTLLFSVKGEDHCSARFITINHIPYHKEQ
jgi:hypothetical protein